MAYDIVKEDVPEFTRRLGDRVLQGSNNTIVIMGTDRATNGPADLDSGLGHTKASGGGKNTGTVHIIAGRASKDPNLSSDKSYLYLTMRSNVDDNLGLGSVENSKNDCAGAILKSDHVRIVARDSMKLSMSDGSGYVFIDGDRVMIKIGSTKFSMDGSLVTIESPEVHLKGGCEAPWQKRFDAIEAYLEGHGHICAVGPTLLASGSPLSMALKPSLVSAKTTWELKAKE